jgi:hypothetical protein
MLAAILRLFILVMVVAGIVILFVYAFVAALIITPILFLLFYFFGRNTAREWYVVRRGQYRRPEDMNPEQGQRPQRPGPVIDHDPNDLSPKE